MSPLAHRLPRDFAHNLGKYLGIFLLLTMAIMFTSGFLAAARSIADIADGIRDDYHTEDLYFVTMYEATPEAIEAVEDLGATVYENFSRDLPLATADAADKDMSVRVYQVRSGDFDAHAYAEGRAPEGPGQIALDRVFCANHGLSVGDTVEVAGEDFELCGIMTLSDYQVTYKNAGDFMFNASTFTVAELEEGEWERLVGDGITYRYSVLLDDRSADLAARIDFEEDLVDAVNEHDTTITDLVDRESNLGFTFASNDVEHDSVMWEILLVLLIVIMAFVFVVLTNATIEQESAVIGTLLASGYRKSELVRHYLVLPTLIGVVGCGLGAALGYTLMSAPMQGLYYNSYSFPPFRFTWHPEVLVMTTLVPFALLVGITLLGLVRKLGATPLQFLRNEVRAKARRGGIALPERMGFVRRFRIRVFARNFSHFATLFFGILFGSLLLLMGIAMLPVVDMNADLMAQSVPAEHLYTLKAPLVIDGTEAQRDAWAAAFELTTNPAYDDLDLDYLAETVDLLEDAGVDLDALGTSVASAEGEGNGEGFALPKAIEDMVEDSVDNRDWHADDPAVLALWRQVAAAADVSFACTDEELATIVEHFDSLHVAFHRMGDDAMDEAWDLLRDLMDAAADDSVDLSNMDDPVNSTAIDGATLRQVERFAVASLDVPRAIGDSQESVTVYGIEPDSRYWDFAHAVADVPVLAGKGVLEKCAVQLGQSFEAFDRSTNSSYSLAIDDVCGNATDMNLYMSIDAFNEFFGEDADNFNGYASDVELPLDERYVASDLTPDKMKSMSEQMQDSMGQIMSLMVILVIPVYLVLIYLLTKTVIDRSARAISYMKVFGYHSREINGLYLRPITYTVLASIVLCVPILVEMFRWLLKLMMAGYSGNFVITLPLDLLLREIGIGIATYLAVAALHMLAIRRVSLALAMKIQE